MYQLVVILKGINEVALMALLGQAALYVLAGSKRETNIVYSMLKTVTAPVIKLARWIAPRFIVDQHIGFFALLLEAILILLKIRLYLAALAPQ
jgi:hypothetical protein